MHHCQKSSRAGLLQSSYNSLAESAFCSHLHAAKTHLQFKGTQVSVLLSQRAAFSLLLSLSNSVGFAPHKMCIRASFYPCSLTAACSFRIQDTLSTTITTGCYALLILVITDDLNGALHTSEGEIRHDVMPAQGHSHFRFITGPIWFSIGECCLYFNGKSAG